jgi:hypothetical protein
VTGGIPRFAGRRALCHLVSSAVRRRRCAAVVTDTWRTESGRSKRFTEPLASLAGLVIRPGDGLPRPETSPVIPGRDPRQVVKPGSKLSTLTWWADTTLGADLGVAGASTDDIYAAMDWLEDRQDAIEAELARRHLAPEPDPGRMGLFDLSSSWLEGSHCPLAARGYSRDGKKGTLQIEYGLLTDPAGRPVAVRVFPGNTGDPAAFTSVSATPRDWGWAPWVCRGCPHHTAVRSTPVRGGTGVRGPARRTCRPSAVRCPTRARTPRCSRTRLLAASRSPWYEDEWISADLDGGDRWQPRADRSQCPKRPGKSRPTSGSGRARSGPGGPVDPVA